MTSVIGEGAPLTRDIVDSIDLCLDCRACETACASAVRYGAMVEEFRAHIERTGARPRPQAMSKQGLTTMMAVPEAFAASVAFSKLGAAIPGVGPLPTPVADMLTGKPKSNILMPAMRGPAHVGRLPEYSPAIGERKYTVCILQGCVMRVLYDAVNHATIRLLQRAGCDVICPPGLGCCGALDVHAGLHDAAVARAREFLSVVQSYKFDAFVSNSAGCGSTLREYDELLADDPVWRDAAKTFASSVKDVSEFLDTVSLPAPTRSFDAVVTYHDACHLVHGQGVREAPRRLLEAVPGVKLVPLRESDMCCGSGGIYNMTQPAMAQRLLERKVDNIAATGAEVVAMGNPGCMAWIEAGLQRRHLPVRVMHVVEILDKVYSAEDA
jgi:glycolate oxidase iron-sulfur subunit